MIVRYFLTKMNKKSENVSREYLKSTVKIHNTKNVLGSRPFTEIKPLSLSVTHLGPIETVVNIFYMKNVYGGT